MNEGAVLGALGFFFVAVGVVVIAAVLGGPLAAGTACVIVGIGLGVVSAL